VLHTATQTIDEVLRSLSSSPQGLSSTEAHQRQLKYGMNRLTAKSVKWWEVLLRQIRSPFMYILMFAAILSFLLRESVDGLMILSFIIVNTLLGFFQEFRSEQALKVLQKYTVSHARVFRDGHDRQLETLSLVPGDVIWLEPGDVVPADVRLIESADLLIDESVLTGESLPVEKAAIAYSGTSILRGTAKAVVVTIGKETAVGEIAKLTVETRHLSSFEKGMKNFSSFVLKLVVITLFFLFVGNIFIKSSTVNIIELLIFSIALATAVIPEALPLVITFSLSRGAVNLAKHKVVVKRLSAIEDLGGIQVLCTDKTGTLTRNVMAVSDLYAAGGPVNDSAVFVAAALAIPTQSKRQDPFDLAILEAVKNRQLLLPQVKHLAELPFDPQRRRNSVLIEEKNTKKVIIRGALEAVLPFCHHMHSTEREQIIDWAQRQGVSGRRVIVIASRVYHRAVTADYSIETEEKQLVFIGCLAFTDPLKTTAAAAIAKAKQLGIQVKILTGDGPAVAGATAKEVGLISDLSQVTTGAEFELMNLTQQHHAVFTCHVFARVSPQQKFAIIELLKEKYEVGYIGEGINDAPALKAANVSLVVQGASDIAKEAADVILLHSSLRVIIDGIQEGREVFANTIKYVRLTMVSNFGNFFALGIASFLIPYLPMLSIQILLVNLLTDLPLIAVATDSVDPAEVLRPERYDLKDFALISTFLGSIASLFDFLFFGFFFRISPGALQTNWFIGSIFCELVLFFSLRTKLPFFKAKMPSKSVMILMMISAAVAVIIPHTAFGQSFFHFQNPGHYLVLTLSLVFSYFVTTEVVKLLYYRVFDTHPAPLDHMV